MIWRDNTIVQIVVRLRTCPNNWHPPEVLLGCVIQDQITFLRHIFKHALLTCIASRPQDLVFWPSHPIPSLINYDSRALFFFLHVSLRPSILGVLFKPDIFHSRFDHVHKVLVFAFRCSENLKVEEWYMCRSVTLTPLGLDNLYPSVTLIFQAVGFKHAVNSLGYSATSYCWTFSLPVSEVSLPFLVTPNTLVFLPPLHKVTVRSINLHPIRAPHCTPFIKLLV